GRAPASNITGVSRSAEMARATARRSAASSPQRGAHEYPQPLIGSPDDHGAKSATGDPGQQPRLERGALGQGDGDGGGAGGRQDGGGGLGTPDQGGEVAGAAGVVGDALVVHGDDVRGVDL